MQPSRFGCLGVLLLAILAGCSLAGCSPAALKTDDPAPDNAGRTTGLGRSLTKAENLETDNNIAQINAGLSMVKADSDGVAPATIEEAKRALKFPDSMWTDSATGKPLVYDPARGVVSRAP